MDTHSYPVTHTDAEWRKLLTPEQYHIMREHVADDPGAGAQRDAISGIPVRGAHRTDHVGLIAFQPDVERVAGNTEPGRRDHGPVGEPALMLVMPPRPRRECIREAEVERREDPQRPCFRLARNRHCHAFADGFA